jgi:hypothetical protein
MQREQLIKQIIKQLQICKDEGLLDLVWKLLINGSY